jgi:hypothetical protein
VSVLGRLVSVAVAAAAVMAALAVLIPALDRHKQLDVPVPLHHRLPATCWSAHEVLREGHVWRLCDFYQPTPRPAPTPHAQARLT